MKKKIMAVAMIAICIAIVASGSIAFFTADEQVHNVITTGAIDIIIEEWQMTDAGLVPYPEQPIRVMPATTVSKIATIRNIDADAYMRARVEIVVMDATGKVMELSQSELDRVIRIAVNEKWLDNGDGWWYYSEKVPHGEATEPLFTEVVFDGPNMSNKYQNCTVDVIVDAQAVQVANNGGNALEAAGWPAE